MQQSIENCQKALAKLKEFLDIAKTNNAEYMHAAVIQAFEYNFELFWKIYQKMANQEGEKIGSPKQAFSFAFQSDLIKNEETWLSILNDRNLTTHTYHRELADQIYTRIANQYYNAFYDALNIIKAKTK
ncbi:MAG: HI0074 family nucleotidyltransferase substrate-binding subunit [Legionellales bacterium]|jgi:nucleotidyltransferase substrate binding protein (TIGR01987 family)